MKITMGIIFSFLTTVAAQANSSFGCGYGNTYKTVVCSIDAYQAFESGYMEPVGSQTIRLSRPYEKTAITVPGLKGDLSLSFGSNGEVLVLDLKTEVTGIPTQSLPVTFPETCNGTQQLFELSGEYTVNRTDSSFFANVLVRCSAEVVFEKD